MYVNFSLMILGGYGPNGPNGPNGPIGPNGPQGEFLVVLVGEI